MIQQQVTVSFKSGLSGVWQAKRYKGFFSDKEDINVVIIAFLSIKPCLSFFYFNLEPRFFGKRTSCPWNQLHFLMKSDKGIFSPKRNKLKEIQDIGRQKTAKDDITISIIVKINVKINVSPNVHCNFLLFKSSAFLQIFFLRKASFKFCTIR